MNIVIQCAKSKMCHAGCLALGNGKKVEFVAHPANAPKDRPHAYAHPDGQADTGRSWREELVRYNETPGDNPLGLLPAWQLYQNPVYKQLAEHYGIERLFILSAGWGLIPGNFLVPKYDITFSSGNGVEPYKRRYKGDCYDDFRMLPANREPMVFFVGKSYIPLAQKLTEGVKVSRYLFYCLKNEEPDAPGFICKKYKTNDTRNWQNQCANEFMAGAIQLPELKS